MDVTPDAYLLETNAARMTQHGPPRREPRGTYDPTGEIARGQFHLLFPGTVINVMPGRPNFSIGPIVPRDVRRRTAFSTTSSPRTPTRRGSRSRSRSTRSAPRIGASSSACRRACGRIHRGRRLLPESEQLIAHFQALVVDALA